MKKIKLTAAELAAIAAALVFAGAAVGTSAAGGDGYSITTGGDAPVAVSAAPEPTETPPDAAPETIAAPAEAETALVNINTASAAELDSLPGIGEVLANRIIEYREEHGGFTSAGELVAVDGIGEVTLEELRGLITVG